MLCCSLCSCWICVLKLTLFKCLCFQNFYPFLVFNATQTSITNRQWCNLRQPPFGSVMVNKGLNRACRGRIQMQVTNSYKNVSRIDRLKKQLNKSFAMKDLKLAKKILGIRIVRDRVSKRYCCIVVVTIAVSGSLALVSICWEKLDYCRSMWHTGCFLILACNFNQYHFHLLYMVCFQTLRKGLSFQLGLTVEYHGNVALYTF
ncbi:unnamed protein product [Citrullus colocynthis]|uniref:Uncharacterized protein n=1 Tax=Citrullus colocynthis TaxID=252529 RepID=A0ABP0YNX9_9ROSI